MPDPVNPLIPAAYDIAWAAVAIIVFTLVVVSLISIGRAAKMLTSAQSLIWTLLAIFVPVIGPLAWIFVGRRGIAHPIPGSASS